MGAKTGKNMARIVHTLSTESFDRDQGQAIQSHNHTLGSQRG